MDLERNFSYGTPLSRADEIADKKLRRIRDQMLTDDPTLITGTHYDKLEALKKSPIYEGLKMMPKPAIHHTHLTATATLDFLLSFTMYDFVYYSEKLSKFIINHEGDVPESYVSCNNLRAYWQNAQSFDDYIKEKILMRPPVPEDHGIWKSFQHKFDLTFELYNYDKFFEKVLYRTSKDYIKEMVTVVEYRHIFGCLFNDKHESLSLEEELAIFYRVQEQIKKLFPLF